MPAEPQKKQEEKTQAVQKPVQQPVIPVAITKEVDEIMRRLRQLEERYSGLRKKSQLIEQNMLKDAKDIFEEINVIHQTVSELKGEMSEISEKLSKLSEEIKGSASKADFNVVSKYLDF